MPAIEQNITSLPQVSADRRLEELRKVTREFEAIFINTMLKAMRNTVTRSNLFPAMAGKDVYTAMLDEHLAREIALSGGVGIGRILFKELSKYITEGEPVNVKQR